MKWRIHFSRFVNIVYTCSFPSLWLLSSDVIHLPVQSNLSPFILKCHYDSKLTGLNKIYQTGEGILPIPTEGLNLVCDHSWVQFKLGHLHLSQYSSLGRFTKEGHGHFTIAYNAGFMACQPDLHEIDQVIIDRITRN